MPTHIYSTLPQSTKYTELDLLMYYCANNTNDLIGTCGVCPYYRSAVSRCKILPVVHLNRSLYINLLLNTLWNRLAAHLTQLSKIIFGTLGSRSNCQATSSSRL